MWAVCPCASIGYTPRANHWATKPEVCNQLVLCIGYTPRAKLLSDLATECCRHEVAKSLGNQARGVQPACTMTTQNSKIRLISSIALKSRLITYLLSNLIGQFELVIVHAIEMIILGSHEIINQAGLHK